MSGSTSKKIRQEYRKDFKTFAELEAKKIRGMFKPKPKYIPWKVWLFFLSFFVKMR